MGSWITQMNFRKLDLHLPTGATVKSLLEVLSEKIPNFREVVLDSEGQLRAIQRFLINGRSIRYLQKLDTPFADGDVVAIFPAVAGG
jgi:MoaD family protein